MRTVIRSVPFRLRAQLAAAAVVFAWAASGTAQELEEPAVDVNADVPLDLPLPPASPPGSLPIPPVVDRPLDVDEGGRVFVRSFDFKGVVDRPEKGISADEVSALVERQRVEFQGLTEVDEGGFTPDERGRIDAFMRKVVDQPDLDLKLEDYQALVDHLRLEKTRRNAGLSIGQLQQVANAVTAYYRSRGFILAQAYVPAQEVQDGVVTIEVLEGRMGQLLTEGNERFSDALLARPFEDLLGAPVTADSVESALLTVSDYPGLSAFGVFRPGEEVRTTDLVLRVQDEDLVDGNLRWDNHGNRFTGDLRAIAELNLNNPTRGGDRLSASVLQHFNPKNSFFFNAQYTRPIIRPGMSLGARYERNIFDVNAELRALELSGRTEKLDIWLRQYFIRSRQANLFGELNFNRTDVTDKQARVPTGEDQLASLTLSASFDNIETETRAINQGDLALRKGLPGRFGTKTRGELNGELSDVPPTRRGGSGKFATSDFWKVRGNLARLQTLIPGQTLLLRGEGQWSNMLLAPVEMYQLGGPNNVRAYPRTEFLRDSALYLSAEYTVNAPGFADEPAFRNLNWGDVLRVSFFFDWANGSINDPAPGDERDLTISGVGAGVLFTLPGQFTARLQWARSVGRPTPSDGDTNRGWFDLTYSF